MKVIDYTEVKLQGTAVALGKFQGLHKGHMLLIHKIAEMAKEHNLISTVFTINMPIKDGRLQLKDERFAILEKKHIDVAVECEFSKEFSLLTPEQFVKNILVDALGVSVVVVGEDFRFGYNRLGDVDRLREFGLQYGFRVVAFPKLSMDGNIISASLIRSLLADGRVDLVNRYTGREYEVTGEVVYGKQLGRTIGFPTINLAVPKEKLLPQKGVYETFVVINDVVYKGITNVGYNPTVDDKHQTHVETHLIGFDEDFYGKTVTVSFCRRLRDEIKFNSVDALRAQLEVDKAIVMHQ